VEQVRQAGLEVELVVEGEPAPLPTRMDLSAYRIMQEALTNAVKHAGRSSVRVLVRYGGGTCASRPATTGTAPAAGPGGPAARPRPDRHAGAAQLFGGELTAGPGPDGGFVWRRGCRSAALHHQPHR